MVQSHGFGAMSDQPSRATSPEPAIRVAWAPAERMLVTGHLPWRRLPHQTLSALTDAREHGYECDGNSTVFAGLGRYSSGLA